MRHEKGPFRIFMIISHGKFTICCFVGINPPFSLQIKSGGKANVFIYLNKYIRIHYNSHIFFLVWFIWGFMEDGNNVAVVAAT